MAWLKSDPLALKRQLAYFQVQSHRSVVGAVACLLEDLVHEQLSDFCRLHIRCLRYLVPFESLKLSIKQIDHLGFCLIFLAANSFAELPRGTEHSSHIRLCILGSLLVVEDTDFWQVDSLLFGDERVTKTFRERTPHLVQHHQREPFALDCRLLYLVPCFCVLDVESRCFPKFASYEQLSLIKLVNQTQVRQRSVIKSLLHHLLANFRFVH